MWLKRCFPYQIKEDFLPDEPTLAGLLERMRSRELPSLEKLGCGWVSPTGAEGPLYMNYDGAYVLMLEIQKRALSASALRHALEERIAEKEQAGEIVSSRVKRELKEELLHSMLPKAFVESVRIPLWVDGKAGWVWIGSSNDKQADMASSFLRNTLGRLPIEMAQTSSAIPKLTEAASQGSAANFTSGSSVAMQSMTDQSNKANFSGIELPDSRVDYAISSGMSAVRIALSYQNSIRFAINDKMQLFAISYDAEWRSGIDSSFSQTPEDKAQADMVLLLPLYRQLFAELVDWLGQSEKQATQATPELDAVE